MAEMDFFERWFGISPDGGDGSTELLYVLAAGAIMFGIFVFMRLKRQRRRTNPR
jgi:hypothetical protein